MTREHEINSDDGQPPVGIDLGTTFSAIASIDETGRPYCLSNEDGDYVTPTALFVDGSDIVVGREAVRASVIEPHHFADCFKRDMGSTVYRNGLNGIEVPPPVLSGFVLRQLKQDAKRCLGEIRKAVITVPAFFDESRRKSTQDAGALAGLDVLDIINEPTAAALAYGYSKGLIHVDQPSSSKPIKLLVYDLGGGTFDVTILEIQQDTYRTIATDGDVHLGGRDFDECIVDYFTKCFIEEHGVDPSSDAEDAAQLWLDAVAAKHTLSHRSKTSVVVTHAGSRCRVDLTREKFESLIEGLLARTVETISIVLQRAQLNWGDIDRLLLVGGSSRIPAVADMLRKVSGKEPDRSLAPDHAVAHGAAIHAAMLMGRNRDRLAKCKLINVNSHSLGVKGFDRQTRRHANSIMIPKDSPLPCRQAKVFRTRETGQPNVQVNVLEGESLLPSECIQLGDCVIRDLPPGLPAGSQIEVRLDYGADGRVSLSAKLLATRQSASVDFYRTNHVDLESLEVWEQRLSTTGEKLDLSDTGSILRHLDALYQKIGEVAYAEDLTANLKREQTAAYQAVEIWQKHHKSFIDLEESKQSIRNHAELVHLIPRLAKLRSQATRYQVQAKYALIVLGRECYRREAVPPKMQKFISKISGLREVLERSV